MVSFDSRASPCMTTTLSSKPASNNPRKALDLLTRDRVLIKLETTTRPQLCFSSGHRKSAKADDQSVGTLTLRRHTWKTHIYSIEILSHPPDPQTQVLKTQDPVWRTLPL